MVGRTLGHYRIEQQIGAGGMGVVYRARDQRLDRDVGLKLLPQGLHNDPVARERLRKEALALSKLNHPNIAQIYDFDTHDGMTFLIIEYVRGETLARKIADGPLPEEVVLRIGMQVASALEAANDVGIVHRDIKPSNIMMTSKGDVKVLDFGLAKLFRPSESGLTQSCVDPQDEGGGTLPYMAPERLKSEPADFRSDIYSLGTVLYETATGRRAFIAPNPAVLISEILNKNPDLPREINPNLSVSLEQVVMRCLAKEPARRYQRASELRVALESAMDRRDAPAAPRTMTEFRARRTISLVVLSILILGIGILIWRTLGNPPRVDGSRPNELAVLPLSTTANDTDAVAFDNGLVETLTSRLTQLSKNHPLQVVPASEIRARDIRNLQEANKQLGATLGLELNVERAGQLIRVNYALVDAREHKQIRGDTITAPASDPFALEDKVADSIVNALQIELAPQERKELSGHGTTQAGAFDYYLQGRGYLQDFNKPANVENAIIEFNHALERDPNYALAYAGLGEAFWHKYRSTRNSDWVTRAKSSCERAVALRNDEAAGYNCLGIVYAGTGAYEKAVEQYQQAVVLQPTDDNAYEGLALAYERMNKPEESEKTFRTAISLRPNYWANYNWLGELYLREGRYSDAESMFSEVTALTPDSYVGYGNLGIAFLSEGQYTKALPLLERSVSIVPTAENTSNLGTLYFQLRRFSDSARTFEKAAALNGTSFEVWGNLGDAYYWSPGERSKAAVAYNNAIRLAGDAATINPRDANLLGYMAVYYSMLGQRKPALERLAQAFSISSSDSELLFSAAMVYNQFGDTERCLGYLEKAVAAGISASRLRDTPNFDNLREVRRFEILLGPPLSQQ
jgi:eukaryotic-like serine/threonine-protein kinase